MTRTATRTILAVVLALISALAIAQTPQTPPPQTTAPAGTTVPTSTAPAAEPAQTAPAGTQTAPATTTQPAQTPASGTSPAIAPVQAPPPQEPGPGPSSPVPTGPTGPPAKGSLSAPSLQAAPAPQGCTANDDTNRVRLKASCGYLVDPNGKPAPNVSLELVESGQQNAYLFVFSQTITDVNGRFDFGPVPSGHYLLRTHAGAPITVYNFISLPTKNAGSNCEHPVEVKAAAVGACNSEVHAGKGTFSIETSPKKPKESKSQSKQQPPSQ